MPRRPPGQGPYAESKNKIPAPTGQFGAGDEDSYALSRLSLTPMLPRAISLSPSLSRLTLTPQLEGSHV